MKPVSAGNVATECKFSGAAIRPVPSRLSSRERGFTVRRTFLETSISAPTPPPLPNADMGLGVGDLHGEDAFGVSGGTGGEGQSATLLSRNAFPITETELSVIAALAIMGLRSRPKVG